MHDKLLILDLDETLIFATPATLSRPADFMFEDYKVYLRPFVREFIDFCRTNFRLAVWTSASGDYAEIIVNELFGKDHGLEFVWSRRRCTRTFDSESMSYEWAKNLGKVKRQGFNLEQVIMVDDTPGKLTRNYGNLVQVRMFEGDTADRELTLLMSYLADLKLKGNMRATEKRGWRARYCQLAE